jgi:hypothetical protein
MIACVKNLFNQTAALNKEAFPNISIGCDGTSVNISTTQSQNSITNIKIGQWIDSAKPNRLTLLDLILRSPAKRSEGGRLEGWQLAQAVIHSHPSRRIACAMLLRGCESIRLLRFWPL